MNWIGENDFLECRTSGSTGEPKLIRLPKQFVIESARRTNSFFGLGQDSHYYSCVSRDFIGGKMMAVRAAESGGRATFEMPSNRPMPNYTGERIDLLAVVPTQMEYLIDSGKDLQNVNAIIIGGAPLSKDLQKKIIERGINAYETYGMTETASHVALKKIDSLEARFLPLEGIKISLEEETGRIKIEIETKCNSGMQDSGDITPGLFSILTNDIGEIFDDGSFLVKGRIDNIINSGGIKINPIEIEEILESEFNFDILITSEPDDKWGEKVVMVIEPTWQELDDEELMKRCRKLLRREWVPKKILRKKIRKTANGKKCRK